MQAHEFDFVILYPSPGPSLIKIAEREFNKLLIDDETEPYCYIENYL